MTWIVESETSEVQKRSSGVTARIARAGGEQWIAHAYCSPEHKLHMRATATGSINLKDAARAEAEHLATELEEWFLGSS